MFAWPAGTAPSLAASSQKPHPSPTRLLQGSLQELNKPISFLIKPRSGYSAVGNALTSQMDLTAASLTATSWGTPPVLAQQTPHCSHTDTNTPFRTLHTLSTVLNGYISRLQVSFHYLGHNRNVGNLFVRILQQLLMCFRAKELAWGLKEITALDQWISHHPKLGRERHILQRTRGIWHAVPCWHIQGYTQHRSLSPSHKWQAAAATVLIQPVTSCSQRASLVWNTQDSLPRARS